MQPFKEREKHILCHHCPKSFKSANGLKYHLDKVHHEEENKMVIGKEVDPRKPPNKPPRSIPPALNLLPPEINLLTEFALIATSPQSPLVQEVSGECGDGRRSEEEDSPPPRLMRPKQMDFDSSEPRAISQIASDTPMQTSWSRSCLAAKWHYFMAGAKVSFPDDDRCHGGVHGKEFGSLSCDMCLDGLQVLDYEMIDTKYNDNSVHEDCIVSFKSCKDHQISLQAEIFADHPFFVKGRGWASFNPSATALHYGIDCQYLERGDICLLPYEPGVVGSFSDTSDFTAMDSTAALTLSSMAKDKEEHSHRRSKLLSVPQYLPSTMKRTSMQRFTKRPMNAFMLFAKRFRLEITQAHPGRDNRAISVILGDKWKAMKQEDRREYVIQAKLLADEHKRVNPDCWKRKRNSESSSKISYRRP